MAFIGSPGEGGAKLYRRNFGEQVENIAASGEYHWMAGNFLKYAGPLKTDDLPIDAHELIALCAPRPVFISTGSPKVEGGWVDAKGMFLGGVAAGPVYKLLGKRDLGTSEFPPIETSLVDGDIAFRFAQRRAHHGSKLADVSRVCCKVPKHALNKHARCRSLNDGIPSAQRHNLSS